jgi:hypothetical protein
MSLLRSRTRPSNAAYDVHETNGKEFDEAAMIFLRACREEENNLLFKPDNMLYVNEIFLHTNAGIIRCSCLLLL